ncbi:MAG: BON domain-containing protein [Actinomycetota bacterium]|nr:BON domain-containing protein [Actinomycetota bacterium]
MKKALMITVLLAFVMALMPACTSITGETAGQEIDDNTITTHAKAIIANDPDVHYFKVHVTTTKGQVVLTGFVNSRIAEDRLVGKIRKIKGVRSVKSELQVQMKE